MLNTQIRANWPLTIQRKPHREAWPDGKAPYTHQRALWLSHGACLYHGTTRHIHQSPARKAPQSLQSSLSPVTAPWSCLYVTAKTSCRVVGFSRHFSAIAVRSQEPLKLRLTSVVFLWLRFLFSPLLVKSFLPSFVTAVKTLTVPFRCYTRLFRLSHSLSQGPVTRWRGLSLRC